MFRHTVPGDEPPTIADDQLIARSFCDVTLVAIAWRDSGVDLDINLPDTQVGSATARLVCRWLRSVEIGLDLTKKPRTSAHLGRRGATHPGGT
jgi:hypothetical protein